MTDQHEVAQRFRVLAAISNEAWDLARQFHETYERLAPIFGYRTREESAKPWLNVPIINKQLMAATCQEIIDARSHAPKVDAALGRLLALIAEYECDMRPGKTILLRGGNDITASGPNAEEIMRLLRYLATIRPPQQAEQSAPKCPPYKGPILQPCSACSAGDYRMEYHDHDYVAVEKRRERRVEDRRKGNDRRLAPKPRTVEGILATPGRRRGGDRRTKDRRGGRCH